MYLSVKFILEGVLTEIEQQLQTQKGEQVSSPHPFECCSWSDIC